MEIFTHNHRLYKCCNEPHVASHSASTVMNGLSCFIRPHSPPAHTHFVCVCWDISRQILQLLLETKIAPVQSSRTSKLHLQFKLPPSPHPSHHPPLLLHPPPPHPPWLLQAGSLGWYLPLAPSGGGKHTGDVPPPPRLSKVVGSCDPRVASSGLPCRSRLLRSTPRAGGRGVEADASDRLGRRAVRVRQAEHGAAPLR